MQIRTNLNAGEITVYGADWCGWTKKQRAYLDRKKLAYTYVNCESRDCPDFVVGFPTLLVDGEVLRGYKEI